MFLLVDSDLTIIIGVNIMGIFLFKGYIPCFFEAHGWFTFGFVDFDAFGLIYNNHIAGYHIA